MANFTYTPLNEEQANEANILYDYYSGGGIFNDKNYQDWRSEHENTPTNNIVQFPKNNVATQATNSNQGNQNATSSTNNTNNNASQESLAQAAESNENTNAKASDGKSENNNSYLANAVGNLTGNYNPVGSENANVADAIERANIIATESDPDALAAMYQAQARGQNMTEYYRAMLDKQQNGETPPSTKNPPSWTQTPEYQEIERQRQINAINDKGRLQTDYYSHMLENMQANQGTTGEVYGSPRNGSVPARANQREAELNAIINGNNNLPENAPPMQVSNGNRQEQTLGDALSALTFRNGVQIPQALNGANRSSGLLSFIAPEASADEMEQIPTRATGEVYGTPRNSNDNYREELARLQQPQGEVYGSQRNGSVPERYIAPRQPLEYSDAFIRQEEMKDAYSPSADYSGSMASDDIQSSSGTASSDEQAMREAYEAAMQSAQRARDIFSGFETSEPEWIPVSEEVNTSQPIDVWAYNRAVADRQRGLNVDQILLAAEDEGSPQSMQYYNWIVNHLK